MTKYGKLVNYNKYSKNKLITKNTSLHYPDNGGFNYSNE